MSKDRQSEFPLYSPHSWFPCHETSQTYKTFPASLALHVLFLAYSQIGELIGRGFREDNGIEEVDLQMLINPLSPPARPLGLARDKNNTQCAFVSPQSFEYLLLQFFLFTVEGKNRVRDC